MNTGKTIKKILLITMWVIIGSGMVTLLAAAMRNHKSEKCTGYRLVIKGGAENSFLEEKDILKIMSTPTGGKIKGQLISKFDLRKLEQRLEANTWIRDAEMYFDNKAVLHVTIAGRKPIARIFNTTGKSFYIDQEEKQLPLSEKLNADVPVFTGFPSVKKLSRKERDLLHDVKQIADFTSSDSFWNFQVAQIDITREGKFEMIPLVGNHLVKLGNGENIENKFYRLFTFYKQVLSKKGFNSYQVIDVQYNGQVVGVKGNESKVNQVELRKSVEQLFKQIEQAEKDTLAVVSSNPVPLNSLDDKVDDRVPKAVMPKRNQ